MSTIQWSGTTDKTELLTQEVEKIIENRCNGCSFSAELISEPVVSCVGADDEVLFRARVKVGSENMLSEEDVLSYLEEARGTGFVLEVILSN